MASPARKLKPQPALAQPVRKRKPQISLAQQKPKPITLKKVVDKICHDYKELKPVGFIYTTNNPFSLPNSFAQTLFHEELLNSAGQPIIQNLSRLNDPIYLKKLTAKLTYCLIKGRFYEQLFQLNLASAKLVEFPQDYQLHYQAFSYLFSDHYSYLLSNAYMELHYPQLLSFQPILNRFPVNIAVKETQKTLLQQLDNDKNKLVGNLQAFLFAAKPINSSKLSRAIIDNIISLATHSLPAMQEFNIDLENSSFPQISIHYSLTNK